MHWLTILLVGIASNLDNLGLAMAYGIKKTKIPLLSNIIIAFISMIITYIAVIAGGMLSEFFSQKMANFLGSLLLILIGLWTIFSKSLCNTSFKKFERVDYQIISCKEAIFLGLILSINCLASGLGIGANGISAFWTVLSIGIFSLLTIGIGCHCGLLLTKTFIGRYSKSISGCLLIFIGLYEMLI